jgi:hypothetical protein
MLEPPPPPGYIILWHAGDREYDKGKFKKEKNDRNRKEKGKCKDVVTDKVISTE